MLKLAPEGYPFILAFACIAIATLFFAPQWVFAIFLFLTMFMIFFFRDPERITPEGRGVIYSPADGRVISVRETDEAEILHERCYEISIFMSLFNVHINRSPYKGTVREVRRFPGKFRVAFRQDSSLSNEHITMLLDTSYGKIVVRQVAGLLARRAVCRVKPGDTLKQGERFGMIKFSSRLDVYLPLNTDIRVKLDDRVRAGETVIGIIKELRAEKNREKKL
jgi:phosphatidylserine decarboxylase